MLTTWIVLGSSPRAIDAYATARRLCHDAIVVTCNRGLAIEPDPDFYFLSDCLACQTWSRDGKAASKRGKTKTVTLRRDPAAMKMRTVDDFDLVVREGHPYEPFQLSGLWCLEFAVRFGNAGRVLLCGLDGYPTREEMPFYFPGAASLGANDGLMKNHTPKIVEPLTNRLVSKYPAVPFVCVGEPCFSVQRPNWEVFAPSP